LFGCSTITYNIKSTKELSGKKLLTGRFVFYINDVPVETEKEFAVFFKEKHDKPLRKFVPDEKGFVYIPVDVGQYYIIRIMHRELNGYVRFPILQRCGINIDSSDTVVNFGAIKINYLQNVTSRIAFLKTYAYPYSGTFIPPPLKHELSIKQFPDLDVTHKYISSKLDISAKSIRNKAFNFPEEDFHTPEDLLELIEENIRKISATL
jgi:hypothetical protein